MFQKKKMETQLAKSQIWTHKARNLKRTRETQFEKRDKSQPENRPELWTPRERSGGMRNRNRNSDWRRIGGRWFLREEPLGIMPSQDNKHSKKRSPAPMNVFPPKSLRRAMKSARVHRFHHLTSPWFSIIHNRKFMRASEAAFASLTLSVCERFGLCFANNSRYPKSPMGLFAGVPSSALSYSFS